MGSRAPRRRHSESVAHKAGEQLRSKPMGEHQGYGDAALPSLGKQSKCAALFGCHGTKIGQRPGRNNDWRGRRGKMTRAMVPGIGPRVIVRIPL